MFRMPSASGLRLLAHTAPEDRGIIEAPLLSPLLEARPAGAEGAVLLVSEIASTVLHGQRYVDILPLLDGTRTRQAVAAELADTHTALQVQTALVSLAAKGYIVSGDFAMDRGLAAYWCSLGVSPRAAEQRLQAAPVALKGRGRGLARALKQMGLTLSAPDGAALTVVATDDYLDEGHAELNRRRCASGRPWTLVRAKGAWPLFGPVFRPGEGGPCWRCLSFRMRANNEVENFLLARGDSRGVAARIAAPPLLGAAARVAAVEIAKWVVLGAHSPLHENVISLDSMAGAFERHPVMRRPQCDACGEEALYDPGRAPVPVTLGPSPKPVCNSGGLRSVPPEETVRAYRHLVSPVSGVVTQLLRTTDRADPWMHVYWAGSNLALKADNLRLLRNSLRTKSSGKGSTPEQAEASALCEAVERYSGSYHGDEIRLRRRFEDFSGEAIHPNAVMLYSERQYENAERFNALGSRFNYVPARFDPAASMDWTPVWSLTQGRTRYLPTCMLYFAAPTGKGPLYCGPDSNGCAAGNTLEEAILQGFFELVERDAFACWWYNRAVLPEVDLDSFDDPYLSGARAYYREHNRDMWVLDATHDFGIPVFISVSRRTDKEHEDIIYAAGAHSDPRIAALRAVCELNQYASAILHAGPGGEGYTFDDPEAMWWWRNAKLADHAYLSPDRAAPRRGKRDYRATDTADVREDVEFCRALVEDRGLEFLVLDQTRPDIGMPVARTIVPGLRHFWARLGPGRLYDVPVAMGWRRRPAREADLNPYLVFI